MYVGYFHRYYGFVFDESIKTTSTKVFSTLAFINILEKLIYLQTLSCLRERHLGNFLYSDDQQALPGNCLSPSMYIDGLSWTAELLSYWNVVPGTLKYYIDR